MREFDALAFAGEEHSMLAHNVTSSNGVDADLLFRTRPGHPLAPVSQRLARERPCLAHGLDQVLSGAARGVLLVAVVRLQNLRLEAAVERPRGDLGQVDQQIDPQRVVAGEDHGGLARQCLDARALGLGVSGGADHAGHTRRHRLLQQRHGRIVVRKVDHRLNARCPPVVHRQRRIAHIQRHRDLAALLSGNRLNRLPHAPACAIQK